MNGIQTLQGARVLLEGGGWTQGAFGRDAQGVPVVTFDPVAVQHCLSGALAAINLYEGHTEARDALDTVMGGDNIVAWNDTPGRTESEVLEAIDMAIEHLEALQAGS